MLLIRGLHSPKERRKTKRFPIKPNKVFNNISHSANGMGLHYPFGYAGYELRFLDTFIYLLDNFCSSCHTNKDVNGNCKQCPIGNLIYKSKEYMQEAYEPGSLKEEAKIVKEIKTRIRKIKPSPLFNATWITAHKRNKDTLLPLRELAKDLEFYQDKLRTWLNYRSKSS